MVGLGAVLLLAGHVTTTALLGNAVLCLDRNPEAAAEVRADRSLVPGAIEEVLRYRTPFPRLGRMTTTDVELGDRRIPARSILLPWVGAANRDPRRYPDPDRFDIHRTGLTWRSGTASTSAWVRRWHGSRAGSPLASCWTGTARSRSTTSTPATRTRG